MWNRYNPSMFCIIRVKDQGDAFIATHQHVMKQLPKVLLAKEMKNNYKP